jgi:hypothetical protein
VLRLGIDRLIRRSTTISRNAIEIAVARMARFYDTLYS